LQTFRQLLLLVYATLDRRHSLTAQHGMTGDLFVASIMGEVAFPETDL
jgi:hypothetical protein